MIKKEIIIIALMIMLLMGITSTVFAAELVLNTQPQATTIEKIGDEITVEVIINNAVRLYGVDLEISFDPSVLSAQIEKGQIFSGLLPSMTAMNRVNNKTGKISFAQVFLGANQGFTGTGSIAKIKIKAIKEGNTALAFTGTELVNADAQPISVNLSSCYVQVGKKTVVTQVIINDENSNKNKSNSKIINDIEKHWANNEVTKLISKGIIDGYPDGSFKPETEITRSELIKMISKAINLKIESASTNLGYKDKSKVPTWAVSYITAATEKGLLKGDDSNNIRPNDSVTRAELITIVVRAFGMENQALSFKKKTNFKDSNKIPSWAVNIINYASANKFISGYPDGTFKSDAPTNRAQTAVIISRFIK